VDNKTGLHVARYTGPRATNYRVLAGGPTRATPPVPVGNRVLFETSGVAADLLHVIRNFIFLILFFVLLAVWAMGWLAFHIAGGLIHLLLIVAVISLIVHLFRGTRPV